MGAVSIYKKGVFMKIPKLEEMTLREKIGQTIVFNHAIIGGTRNVKTYFTENPIGAFWTMTHNHDYYNVFERMGGCPVKGTRLDEKFIDQLNFINGLMKVPAIPVMDAAQGISSFDGHGKLPTALGLGATHDPELAYEYGKCLGDDLYSIGFRWVWSPVADNPGHYRDPRVLSADTESNCKMLAAFIKGLKDAGVAAGAKHFPGEDQYEYRDAHFCTAAYSETLEYWEKTQGREFKACIDAGVDSIMVGHYTFVDVDDTTVNGAYLPATLSEKVIKGLLREKMGFEGVVLTDAVGMKSLTSIYPPEKLYVELLRAGNDMILGPESPWCIDVIEKAVLSGDLPESRIDEACTRILKMKEKYGLFDQGEIVPPTEERRKEILDNTHVLCERIAEKGLTLCANRTGFLPLNKNNIKRVKIIYIGYLPACLDSIREYAVPEFEKYGATVSISDGYPMETGNSNVAEFDKATITDDNSDRNLESYDLIIYATYIGMHQPRGGPFFFGDKCTMMMKVMTKAPEKSIAVSFGCTDIFFNYFAASHTFINCYSYNRETMEAFVKGLYGDIQFTDYNPLPLNPIKRNDNVYG